MTIAVHHMDRNPSQPSPNSVNVDTRSLFRSISEVKRELKKLVRLAAQDEEDCSTEIYDEICDKAQALKNYKCCKPQPAAPSKSRSFSEQLDSVPVPDCFQCPISTELMRDPVILASGQTYDRASIQSWLDAGNRTCPTTQQILPHLSLTPNYLVRTMIEQWCRWQGFQLECPLGNPNPSPNANEKSSEGMTPEDRAHLSSLVVKLSEERQSQRREAARQLRALTRKKSLYRAHLAQEEKVIPLLIPLLLSPDSETQEHAVTTLLNLSILDTNKKLIVEEGVLPPMLEVLRNGSMTARENAAASLFSLSALEDNKIVIGASGAIPALVELLRDGSWRGKTDAASALFNLCISQGNRGKCVRAGVVPVLLKLMKNVEEGGLSMADEALAILALIAGNEEGAAAIRNAGGALPLLIQFIKHSSPRNKENAVVILFTLCSMFSAYYQEVKGAEEGDGYVALLDLSISGTSRARRKAYALLEKMNRHDSV